MSEIMSYVPAESFLHRLPVLLKIAAIVGVVAASVLTHSVAVLGAMVLLIGIAAGAAGLHRDLVRQIPLLLFLGVALLLLTVVTMQSGETLFHLIPYGIVSSAGAIPVTSGAVNFAAVLSLRFFAMLFVFQLLIMSTRPTELTNALMTLRMPIDYVLMFVIALRFIPSLQLEGQRIHEAQLARGYNPGKGMLGKIRSLRPLLVPLVSNSLSKTRVLGLTIDMRGYRTRVR
ncbi:MAG: energy-coupling factor transporter transmembrane component T [Methanomicrobiaceae archaeon]|nr:energy-coupling factor transporter transmembrane component T [Methanomicrobiaceae archaeon]